MSAMSLWTLERIRLLRSRRWIALVGVFLFFGLLGPITAAYLADLIGALGGAGEGVVIELPDPTAVDGLVQYVSNVSQLGVLVAVVVAASAIAFDTPPEMGVFLRTRVAGTGRILLPRMGTVALATVAAFWLGTVAAWYETAVLIEAPDPAAVLTGGLITSGYWVFMVAVVAAVSGLVTSQAAIIIWSLFGLLLLPIVGIVERLSTWLPSHLLGAMPAMQAGAPAGDYTAALAVTALATVALTAGAIRLVARREL